MTGDVAALVLAAPETTAEQRAGAARVMGAPPTGSVVVGTCHRFEVLASESVVLAVHASVAAGRVLVGDAAVRHILRLAMGLESVVLGEDQVLHQLRHAVRDARLRGALPVELGRLMDQALRQGRIARSWLPARRRSMADVAFDAIRPGSWQDERITVVGRGPMGRLLATAAVARGAEVVVEGRDGPMAPGSMGVAVALAGPWTPPVGEAERLIDDDAWVVDLSAPMALDAGIRARLGDRYLGIDGLADAPSDTWPEHAGGARLHHRLEHQVEIGLAAHRAWRQGVATMDTPAARVSSVSGLRDRELEALWRRLPDLSADQRAEIERMAARLAERVATSA